MHSLRDDRVCRSHIELISYLKTLSLIFILLCLVCVSDVADHPEFADRKRTIVDFERLGAKYNITDWFVVDFTLEELKTLRVYQVNQERDQSWNGKFQMVTFHEHVMLAKNANKAVAITPELKFPGWVNSLNLFNDSSYEEQFVTELAKYGYKNKDDPCIIQSFEYDSIKRLASLTDMHIMMLIKYAHQATPDLLDKYAKVAYGIGAWKCSFVDHCQPENDYKNWIRNVSDLVEQIHNRGMKVHVFTFRNENSNLAWDYGQDPWKEYDLYMDLGVDGYFTDFPATLDRYLDVRYGTVCRAINAVPGQVMSGVVILMGIVTVMVCS